MNYFKCGDRVKLKSNSVLKPYFPAGDTGVVVGYATLQSGVPCLLVSMDSPARAVNFPKQNEWVPRELTERLAIPMDGVEPL